MTEEEMIENGKQLFDKCYSGIVPMPVAVDAKDFSGMTMKMFNDSWGDDRLSFRDKRLVVLGAIAALGGDPSFFMIHARSALQNGELEAEEIRSAILMALPYVGFPRASPLFLATEKLFAERRKTGD